MASPSPAIAKGGQPNHLLNKPQSKLPPIPKGLPPSSSSSSLLPPLTIRTSHLTCTTGTRIQKRPLPGPSPSSRPRTTTASDQDGYTSPPLASHTCVIKVSSSASFMSLVRRVRKALEKAPSHQASSSSTTRGPGGVPLAARIDALRKSGGGGSATKPASGVVADALDDVVLVATGRAIERAVDVGGFFTREKDLVVLVRTRTVRAVDDVVAVDEEEDVEDQVRVRCVSCVEVGIRWAS